MERVTRAAFFNEVANHCDVRPWLGGDGPLDLTPMVEDPRNVCLQFEHGGFVLRNVDGYGVSHELHSLFLPKGWGRPVMAAAVKATAYMFEVVRSQLLYTFEQEGHGRSRAPRSLGWTLATPDFTPIAGLSVRVWYLTPELWRASSHFTGRP